MYKKAYAFLLAAHMHVITYCVTDEFVYLEISALKHELARLAYLAQIAQRPKMMNIPIGRATRPTRKKESRLSFADWYQRAFPRETIS